MMNVFEKQNDGDGKKESFMFNIYRWYRKRESVCQRGNSILTKKVDKDDNVRQIGFMKQFNAEN